jgi:cytochrome c oxidase cbb3-type subunit I/II
MLGVPYGEAVKDGGAVRLAKEQANKLGESIAQQGGPEGVASKKIVALIAYMQRLGTDIKNTAPAASATEATTPATTGGAQ